MEYKDLLLFRFNLKENIYYFVNKYPDDNYFEYFKIVDGIDFELYIKLPNKVNIISAIIVNIIAKSKSIVLDYFNISLQDFDENNKKYSLLLVNNTLKDVDSIKYYQKFSILKYSYEETDDIIKIIFPDEKDKDHFIGNYIEIIYSKKNKSYEYIQFQNWFYGNIICKNNSKAMHLWENDEAMKKGSKAGYEIRFMDGVSKDETIEELILYDNIIEILNINIKLDYYKIIRGVIEKIKSI